MSHLDQEQLSALIDGELSLTHRHAALSHLEQCHACAARHEALIDVAAGLQAIEPVTWTPALSAAVAARLDAPVERGRSVVISVAVAVCGFALVVWQLPALRAVAGGAETLATLATALVPAAPGAGLMAALSLLALMLAGPLVMRAGAPRR